MTNNTRYLLSAIGITVFSWCFVGFAVFVVIWLATKTNGHKPVLLTAAEIPAEPTTWHLLTQSYGGTVSLINNLTKHECEYARARALPPAEGVYMMTAGTITMAECFE